MANSFKLIISTPDKVFFNGDAISIKTDTTKGGIEILANHMPLITLLKPTQTVITDSQGNEKAFFSSYGIMKVVNNEVTFLCDAAELPEEIDIKRAEEAKERAEKRIQDKNGVDLKRAETALYRSLARLKVKGH